MSANYGGDLDGRNRLEAVSQNSANPHVFTVLLIMGSRWSCCLQFFNYEHGTVNTLLRALHIPELGYLHDSGILEIYSYFFSAWKAVGYGAVFYMASILSIDRETYEAAEIDGANVFQRIRYITLPSLRPTITILVLLAIGGIFRGDFGLFYQLVGNNGLLYQTTDVIDTYVYRSLLVNNEIGMSSAIGFYQSILCFATIMVTNFLVRKSDKENALF